MEAKYLTVVVSRSNAIEIPMAEEVWAGMSEADQDVFVRQYAANQYKENLKWRVREVKTREERNARYIEPRPIRDNPQA